MRFSALFSVFAVILGFLMISAPSQAGFGDYIWGPPQSDVVTPYLQDAKLPHNSYWADDEWRPQDWIDARGGSAVNVMQGLYNAGVITDQYFDDEIPVLEVGQTFIELSNKEKRRVVAFVDSVFNITSNGSSSQNVILLYFHKDDVPIGLFNREGLQLQ